jgi:TolB-like protein
MAEMKFQSSDWSDSDKVAKLGVALNANSIIRGQLMKLSDQLIITTSILDIKTTQILSSSRVQLKSIDEIFNKLPELVKQMIANLPDPPGCIE